MLRCFLAFLVLACLPTLAFADGPADNNPETVRRVPKLGVEVPAEARAELEKGLQELRTVIDEVRAKPRGPGLVKLLPDVEIYHKAVHDALKYQEFFDASEIEAASRVLATGLKRAQELKQPSGGPVWYRDDGLVVRGYTSKIDDSVQPYGLVVPRSYDPQGTHKYRLDVWFHGRGENLSELNFIRDRERNEGTFTPADTIVLHPYGRYCNAFKFAGEVDVLEAIESVKQRYRIDDDRISVRGFSMGGAGAWHFAVHYPDRWFAANPGAGFSETPDFLKVFQKETLNPMPWEKTLWQWYDCPEWAGNIRHCPTVAYSGELDSQKQAADIMEAALKKDDIDLLHVIGPQTKHEYHPAAKLEVEQRMDALARGGREVQPIDVQFVTSTLKYNRLAWLTVDGLGEHWQPASVTAGLLSGELAVETENVTAFTVNFESGDCPFDVQSPVIVSLDEQEITAPRPKSDRSWRVSFYKVNDEWRLGERPAKSGLQKKHNLQGPIDDALMDSFYFVRPTGKALSPAVDKWARSELDRAIEQWRRNFRGEARVVDDTAVTDETIAGGNLILWGDPGSNAVLAKIVDKLPIGWQRDKIKVGEKIFNAAEHGLIACYPNPLNPERYVVLNSSFTFRDYAYLNNARQVPMLPDWAVVDTRTPPGNVWPGKIVAADFFDEQWQLKEPASRKD